MIEFYDNLDEEVEAAIKQSDEYFAQERKRKLEQGMCYVCHGVIETRSLFGMKYTTCENDHLCVYPKEEDDTKDIIEQHEQLREDLTDWMKEQTDEY